ncbi:DUF4347 domain-containing protein [Thalassobaculum sp. OXR-137]|uniref:DUF4347 domain-containing protein n=1 Tax=Thalassobaculum sp. OXR-137 TaxID=3100173 RepID=UPI002AC9E264|nr:DUF4347 domain-containing protein [Thalassobaculum sp. OXR-137]WPZ36421.1 DUF4347 domain-containing protein [Thalassobaculum sp. OXR-137]
MFIDRRIDRAEILLSGLRPDDTCHLLRGIGDPLWEIASILSSRRNVERLVVLAHGSPGVIELSGKRLDRAALRDSEEALASIRAALTPDADLVLASCATGAGPDGAEFVDTLETALGVTVSAASADLGGTAGWDGLPVLASVFRAEALDSYPYRLAVFDFESVTGSGTATLTQTVSGVTLTATRSDGGNLSTSSTGGVSGNFLDSTTVVNGTMTLTFSAPVTVTALAYWEASNPANTGGNYVLTPSAGTPAQVLETSVSNFHTDLSPADWTGITTITVSYSGGGNYFAGVDQITFTVANVNATTNAAGFNTTNGTNLTPASTFGSADDTLTVADASHITSTSVANGGGGTDTLILANGSDLSTAGFTLTSFETLTLAANATATMSETQYEAFTTVNGNTGTETIVLSSANGDGTVIGSANIESFTLNGAFTFSIGTAGQNVTGSDAADQTVRVGSGISALSGILNGGAGGSDRLLLNTNVNIADATVSNFEILSLTNSPSVTMTVAQHDGFSSMTGGGGADQITFSATGGDTSTTGNAAVETYVLNAAGIAFTLGAASQNVTGSTGADTVNVGTLTATGTLSGGTGTDILQLGTGANIAGATVSGFETLTLTGGASVTMTEAQHDAFSSVTATGNDTITISAYTNGFQTQTAVENYVLGVANAVTVAGGAQNITGSTGNDTITFQGLTYTGTLSGGAGTDVIQATTGTNFSGAAISGVENLTLAGNASVTMSLSQFNTFAAGIITAGGSETVTLSGDGTLSTASAIENYTVGDDSTNTRTVTVNSAGHSVSATSTSDAVTFDTGTLTLAGTLTGEGTVNDILSLGSGANISGATITNIEDLTLASGASVTMTAGQLNGFSGTVTGAGSETVILSATGTISGSNLGAIETLSTASGGSETITLAASIAAGKTLTAADTGNDHFVVTGATGAQSVTGSAGTDTLDGGAGADTLGGGAGADRLTGGDDADVFTGSVSDLNGDTVTDLTTSDSILLTGVTGLSTSNVRFNGTNLEIDTNATTFASPEVSIGTVSNLTSTLTISSVADSNGNTLITFASPSVSATTTAAGFNTTNGTSLNPASTFGATDDTLTIASASHISSTSVANGGNGTDTVILADGSDLTTTGFTLTSFETVTLSANATATMSESQHDGFTTINGNSGTEGITLNAANGDGTVTGDADIETYTLDAAFTFTLGAAGQNVTGSAGANQTVQSSTSIDTLTGTLNGGAGGSDTLILDTGDNLSGATVSNFENLTLDNDASVTMTAAQLNGFTGTTTAAATETVTLSATGSITTANITPIETLATAADAGAQTITLTAAQAAGKTLTAGDSGQDHFVVTGSTGSQSVSGSAGGDTLDGGAGDDTVIGAGGADAVSGGAGNDIVSGGSGFDTLAGGDGTDTFSGSAADFNGDTISDFAAGDSIVVTGKDLSALNGTTASGTIDISGSVETTLTGITSASGTFNAVFAAGNTTITLIAPSSGGGGDTGSGTPTIVVAPSTPTVQPGGGATSTAQTITNNGTASGSAAIVQNTNNNGNVVTATLPPQTTITSEGPTTAQTPQNALTTLVTSIQARGSTAETGLVSGAQTFLTRLSETTTLDVRTIVPTTTSSSLSSPIVITGTSGGSQSEAFVIDLRSLPSGSTLQLDNIEFASVMGSSTVTGGAGDNYVTGDDNSQFISLGVGDDTLFGGAGADTIGSGSGRDFLYGNEGNDRVLGGTENDAVYGGQNDDVVYGNQANDVVYGNRGADTLYGGQDADSLYGGQQADLVHGNQGDDLLYGNKGADTLIGGDGNDTLYGGLSSEQGGDGTSIDVLGGGAGDDAFYGGEGVDWIYTGSGADKIYIDNGNGFDVVADFDVAAGDMLMIRTHVNGQAISSAADLIARATDNAEGDAVIDLGGQHVRLIGIHTADLTENYFGFF